jgi:transposase
MREIVKQVVGIDVAQNELVVSVGRMYNDWTPEVYAFKTFSNQIPGFKNLIAWIKKVTERSVPVRYVMEATGVYHESLAYFLDEQNFDVSIVLPNKISNYFRTLEVKTVTDKTASEVISRFGLERKLDGWKKPKPIYKRLRQLTRERSQIIDQRTIAKNQMHAEKAEVEPNKSTLARLKKSIAFFDGQEKEVKKEIDALIKSDEQVCQAVQLISSICGVAQLSAATVLGETNGFELIRNKKQLTSYAGYDVKEKLSGTSVKGKARISKRGNKYLRKAMHLPALTAIRHDDRFKGIFIRIVAKNGIKMKAAVAVQRKLLEMIYTIYKSRIPYNKNYFTDQLIKKLERSSIRPL